MCYFDGYDNLNSTCSDSVGSGGGRILTDGSTADALLTHTSNNIKEHPEKKLL